MSKTKSQNWQKLKDLSRINCFTLNSKWTSKSNDLIEELNNYKQRINLITKIKKTKYSKDINANSSISFLKNIQQQQHKLSRQIARKLRKEKIKKTIKEQEENLKNFYNHIMNGEEGIITLKKIPIQTALSKMPVSNDFHLLIGQNNQFKTIRNNEETKTAIKALSDSRTYTLKELGSDIQTLLQISDSNTPYTISCIKKTKTRQHGAYFNFYNKLLKVNLEKYGIYHKSDKPKYDINCLEDAFVNGGMDVNKFNKCKSIITSRDIPKCQLRIIAETLKITIKLKFLKQTKARGINFDSIYYNKGQDEQYNICLINNHYFLDEKTIYTMDSIKYYHLISDKEKFNEMVLVKDRFRKKGKKIAFSSNIINFMLNNEDNYLEKITLENSPKDNHFSDRKNILDYTDLPEITENDYKLIEKKDHPYPKIFTKRVKINDTDDEINASVEKMTHSNAKTEIIKLPHEFISFDFESTTDGDIHRPYLICSKTRKGIKQAFKGEFCAINWLKSIRADSICMAHNLRYDFSFLIQYLSGVRDMIKTGNQIKTISGIFYNNETKESYRLYFKDSCSLIPGKLRDFENKFNLPCKKEVMPYEIYNEDTVLKESIKVSLAKNYLSNEDYKEFNSNIDLWGLRLKNGYFDHMEYSKLYCDMDVKLLLDGYEVFKKWMFEITGLNIDYIISIPSLAYKFMVDQGCMEGCYQISGIHRDFIQRCLVGGRCMTRDNKRFEIKHKVMDFDAKANYPSAMTDPDFKGFLKGTPKLMTDTKQLKTADYYFIQIRIDEIPIKRNFPLLSKVYDMKRNFSNDLVGEMIYIDKTALEDAIKFQNIKYTVLKGYYFDEGFNNNINKFITFLYNERAEYKKARNQIQEAFKLIMNSCYGKLIQKPIKDKYTFKYNSDALKYLNYRFNHIRGFVKITDNITLFQEDKSIIEHFSSPHIGIQILSMAKRIMNRPMALAEDLNIDLYYQDTDSMHIDYEIREKYNNMNGVEYLSTEYKKLYGRELIGPNMGQFDCDFSSKLEHDSELVSVNSIYLGKKTYIDKLEVIKCNQTKYDHHIRAKGLPNASLLRKIKEKFNEDPMEMYRYRLYNDKKIKFNLDKECMFTSNPNFTYKTNGINNNRSITRSF